MRYALLLLLVSCASRQSPAIVESPILAYPVDASILRNRELTDGFATLVRQSAYGRHSDERAAFIVRGDDGRFRLEFWPARNDYHAARWRGTIPSGTIAIAHTHPIEHPEASAHDCSEAQRIGVPIFVLTPESVILISASDGSQETIAPRGWLTK